MKFKPFSLFLLLVAGMVAAQTTPSSAAGSRTDGNKTAASSTLISLPPYLQNLTEAGVVVRWQTNRPVYSWVEFGTSPDTSAMQKVHRLKNGMAVANNLDHRMELSGLKPATTYYYRVCSREITLYQPYKKEFGVTEKSEVFAFQTVDPNQKSFSFIVFNDLHNGRALFDSLRQQLGNRPYDFVIFNGDCLTDLASAEAALPVIAHYNQGIEAASYPPVYIRGNHEIRGAYSQQVTDHFDWPGDKAFFAFTHGKTRFVILDCGEDKPDTTAVYYGLNDFSAFRQEQADWLQKEIRSDEFKKADFRVLVHHIPTYGLKRSLCLDLWKPALETAGFDLAINAHTHRHEVLLPEKTGFPYPVAIGGSSKWDDATVMHLTKTPEKIDIALLGGKNITPKTVTIPKKKR